MQTKESVNLIGGNKEILEVDIGKETKITP